MEQLTPAGEVLAAESPTPTTTVGRILDQVEAWHNDVHDGVFRRCTERPCYGVTRTAGAWHR